MSLKINPMDEKTLERIYPKSIHGENINSDTFKIHIERYQYAASKINSPGIVADVACGSGYGSFFLASNLKNIHILAIDNNIAAIDFARMHFSHDRINYVVADAMKFLSDELLNYVVSLETIEHLPDPGGFVKRISSQLVSGGRIIASAPITPSMDGNIYHLHDFSKKSFKQLFTSCNLREIDSFVQKQNFNPLHVLGKKAQRSEEVRKNLFGYYLKKPGKLWSRIKSIFKDGFNNKYLVVVFEKP